MKLSRRYLNCFILLVILLQAFSYPVYAGEPLTLESADISVRPEYDTSDILVIYKLEYVNKSSEPFSGEIKLKVPKEAANPQNLIITEEESTDRNSEHIQPSITDQTNYAEFTWKPKVPVRPGASYPLHIEYYYNNIVELHPDKVFYFFYQPSQPTEKLNIRILQPLKATNMRLDPAYTSTGTDNDGFTYFDYTYTNPGPEDKFEPSITYLKTDPAPSIQLDPPPSMPQQPNQTSEAAPEGSGVLSGFNWPFFISVCLLVAGLLLFAWIIMESLRYRRAEANEPGQSQVSPEEDLKRYQKQEEELLNRYQMGLIDEMTYVEMLAELEAGKRTEKDG